MVGYWGAGLGCVLEQSAASRGDKSLGHCPAGALLDMYPSLGDLTGANLLRNLFWRPGLEAKDPQPSLSSGAS